MPVARNPAAIVNVTGEPSPSHQPVNAAARSRRTASSAHSGTGYHAKTTTREAVNSIATIRRSPRTAMNCGLLTAGLKSSRAVAISAATQSGRSQPAGWSNEDAVGGRRSPAEPAHAGAAVTATRAAAPLARSTSTENTPTVATTWVSALANAQGRGTKRVATAVMVRTAIPTRVTPGAVLSSMGATTARATNRCPTAVTGRRAADGNSR